MDEENLNWPVTVTLFNQERYDGEWMPEKLTEAIAWLQKFLEQVPEECHQAASIEIGSTGGYEGDHYATIEISYERPPTAEEKQERLNKEQRDQVAQEANERRAYERLKTKYDPPQ